MRRLFIVSMSQTICNSNLKNNNIMKASNSRTATESKTGQYFSSLRSSKRAQWAQYRNFNR